MADDDEVGATFGRVPAPGRGGCGVGRVSVVEAPAPAAVAAAAVDPVVLAGSFAEAEGVTGSGFLASPRRSRQEVLGRFSTGGPQTGTGEGAVLPVDATGGGTGVTGFVAAGPLWAPRGGAGDGPAPAAEPAPAEGPGPDGAATDGGADPDDVGRGGADFAAGALLVGLAGTGLTGAAAPC